MTTCHASHQYFHVPSPPPVGYLRHSASDQRIAGNILSSDVRPSGTFQDDRYESRSAPFDSIKSP